MMMAQHLHPPPHLPTFPAFVGADNHSYHSTSSASSMGKRTGCRRSNRRRNKQQHAAVQNLNHTPPNLVMGASVWGAQETKHLEEALAKVTTSPPQHNCHSQQDDDALRKEAVEHLETLLAKWVPSSSTPVNPWNRIRPTVVTFGSYRLGVHRADSDLDLLALCPPEYSRMDFFQSWVTLLEEDDATDKIHPIPGAYTPVIKFHYKDTIQVDMLFARVADGTKLRELQQQNHRGAPSLDLFSNRSKTATLLGDANVVGETVTNPNTAPLRVEYTIDDTDLKDQDEAGVRSLNGARVSQMLLEMVPDIDTFRIVLRAVKEWAVARGIYSNVLGFLGGVNFAILVAWICRNHPKEDPPMLLYCFFRTFSVWRWPDPVALLPIQSKAPEGAPEMPAWDPQRYPRDRLHVMPIVTPAYPSMNSTYNCGQPQLRRIRAEFLRAADVLTKTPQPPMAIRLNNTETSSSSNEDKPQGNEASESSEINVFSKLFEPSNFFSVHEHFLQITIRANNERDYLQWFRLVESRLRLLIANLDTPELHVWPYSHEFERKYDAQGNLMGQGRSAKHCTHESLFFIALRFSPDANNQSLSLVPYTSDFLHKINAWQERKEGMDLSLAPIRSHELPEFLRPKQAEGTWRKGTQKGPRGNHYNGNRNHRGGEGNHRNHRGGEGNRNHYNGNGYRNQNLQHHNRNKNYHNGQQYHRGKYDYNHHNRQNFAVHHGAGGHYHPAYHHTQKKHYYHQPQPYSDNQAASVASSSSLSYERAETEETQSMASDVSFSESICSSSSSTGSGSTGAPKRICVVGNPKAPFAGQP